MIGGPLQGVLEVKKEGTRRDLRHRDPKVQEIFWIGCPWPEAHERARQLMIYGAHLSWGADVVLNKLDLGEGTLQWPQV